MEDLPWDAAYLQKNALQRPQDVRLAIDQTEELYRSNGRFEGRLNLDRFGVSGRTSRASNRLAGEGQRFIAPEGREMKLGDRRIKTALPINLLVSRNQSQLPRLCAAIKVR